MPEFEKNIRGIKKRVEKKNILLISYRERVFALYKHLTTVLVALLGLLIGLKPFPVKNLHPSSNTLFLLSLSLIALCVLCCVGVLIHEVSFQWRQNQDYHNVLSEYINHQKKIQIGKTNQLKTYKYFQYAALVFLTLAMFSLVGYAYVLVT